ncbi:MAG: hypothetical protein IH934_07855 [Nanoarchaeota archaeon]|nr:hypothetical protein [Nanoarchaeota archaeon]
MHQPRLSSMFYHFDLNFSLFTYTPNQQKKLFKSSLINNSEMTSPLPTMGDISTRLYHTAQKYVGKSLEEVLGKDTSLDSSCGNFVRKVLDEEGIQIQGRLRDFGQEIPFEERHYGDILLIYMGEGQWSHNSPFHCCFAAEGDMLIQMRNRTVRKRDYHEEYTYAYKIVARRVT